VCVLSFGENYTPLHALVAARGDRVTPAKRGGAVLGLLADGKNPVAAQALVPLVGAVPTRS